MKNTIVRLLIGAEVISFVCAGFIYLLGVLPTPGVAPEFADPPAPSFGLVLLVTHGITYVIGGILVAGLALETYPSRSRTRQYGSE